MLVSAMAKRVTKGKHSVVGLCFPTSPTGPHPPSPLGRLHDNGAVMVHGVKQSKGAGGLCRD